MSMASGRRITASGRSHEWVLGAAITLLATQLAFRAWAAWSSWYLRDDLLLLHDASDRSWQYLVEPYAGHVLPGGKLIVAAVAAAGGAQWWPAVVALLAMQLIASATCWWMLVTLFGHRWSVLPLFGLYLVLVPSLTAYMWLSAAILYLPLQAALAAGVAAWVLFCREGRTRWLVVTLLSLLMGLFFWQKAIFLLPLVAYLSFAYFNVRPLALLRSRGQKVGWGLVGLALVGGAYSAYYLARVPSEVSAVTPRMMGELADVMLGETLVTGLVGGPWRWSEDSSPNSLADPADWMVHLAWLLVSAVAAYTILRRRRAWRAWALLIGYAFGTYLLVLGGRASNFGADIGAEARYLAELPLLAALCLGLACLDLPGASGSSETRQAPLVARLPRAAVATVGCFVVLGSVYSSTTYVLPWHRADAAPAFFDTFGAEMNARGRVDLVDSNAPVDVMPQFYAPRNAMSYLAPLVTSFARFPPRTSDLAIVAPDGSLRQVIIDHGVDSRPGPLAGCGWKVTGKDRSIPLNAPAFDYFWWVRIGYLASASSPVTISAGPNDIGTYVRKGLNNLYLKVQGGFDQVTIRGLDPGTTLCVDTVEVGQPEPGAPLP